MKKTYWIIAIVALAGFAAWRWWKLQPVKEANKEIEKAEEDGGLEVVSGKEVSADMANSLKNMPAMDAGTFTPIV